MSEFQDYKARFFKYRDLLHVPADCTVRAPQFRAPEFIDPQSWDFSWVLTFSDQHYVSCHEILSHRAGRPVVRHYFSFHYGPIVRIDPDGRINRDDSNPLVIRIDRPTKGLPPHLHYGKPHPFPHYDQSRIHGLVLLDADMFQFVNAILRSRSEGIEVHVAMGFTYE